MKLPKATALCAGAFCFATACNTAPAAETEQPLSTFTLGTSSLTLPAPTNALQRSEEGRLLLELDGLVLRVQAVPASADTGARTPATVAAAMALRFEMGEQDGQLSHVPCAFAGDAHAACVVGTFERRGATWIRRGAFVSSEANVLWLDVSGPAERTREVDAWNQQLATRAVLGGAS